MPRVGFGQTNDLSSLFAALYNQYINETQQNADYLEQKNKERQAAKDSEVFDKFQQGQLSGAALLDYIRGRISDTKTDPAEQTKWKNALRDYTNSIGDQNAEDAFTQNGDVHALINYYQGRKAALTKGTPEYSQITSRLYQLIDKAASDDITIGAQRIQDKIDHGQATLGDLASFYQNAMKNLRPGSTLKSQLQTQYDSVKEAVFKQGVETKIANIDLAFQQHKISGAQANQQLLAAASTYKASDPTRWVSMVEQGQSYIKTDAINNANTKTAQIQYLFTSGQITGQQASVQTAAIADTLKNIDPQSYWDLLKSSNEYLTSTSTTGIPNPGALSKYGVPTLGTTPGLTLPGVNPGTYTGPKYTGPAGNNNTSSAAQALIDAARQFLGTPYKLGAENGNQTDCSGLVYQAFMSAGLGSMIDNKRLLAQGYTNMFAKQGQFTRQISDAQPGDLVVYGDGNRVTHIGIYLGDFKVMSALTTTGVTVTRVNTLDVQLKGFLVMDWSKAPGNYKTSFPRKPAHPDRPGGTPQPDNSPDAPKVGDQGPKQPQTVDFPTSNQQKATTPSQTDSEGSPRPYNLPVPTSQDDIKNQQDTLTLMQRRALDMADAYANGATTFTDGTPLTPDVIRQTANDALSAIDYSQALNFAMNDPNAANEAADNRATLTGHLLNSGDTRQTFLLNRMTADVNMQLDYADTYYSDPAKVQSVIQSIANRYQRFGDHLQAGDPTGVNPVDQAFYQQTVKPIIDAYALAADPNTDPAALQAAVGAITPSTGLSLSTLPDVLLGINKAAKDTQAIADGTMVQAIAPPTDKNGNPTGPPVFMAIPATTTKDAAGNDQVVPGVPGFVPVIVDGKVVWALPQPTASTNKVLVVGQAGGAPIAQALGPTNPYAAAIADLKPGDQLPTGAFPTTGGTPDTLKRLMAGGFVATNPLLVNSVTIPEHQFTVDSRVAKWDAASQGLDATKQITNKETWVQDPEQLTWFKTTTDTTGAVVVPQRTPRVDPFGLGTVYVAGVGDPGVTSATAGPQFAYSPDRGLAFPYQGDAKAAQSVIDSGILGNYMPAQTGRDQNGEPVALPPGADTSTFLPGKAYSYYGSPNEPGPNINAQTGFNLSNFHAQGAVPSALNGGLNFPGMGNLNLPSPVDYAKGLGILIKTTPGSTLPPPSTFIPPVPLSSQTHVNDQTGFVLPNTPTVTQAALPKVTIPDYTSRNNKYASATEPGTSFTPPSPTPPIASGTNKLGGRTF